jgi:hypothetical protein
MNPAAQFDPAPFACLHIFTGFQPVAGFKGQSGTWNAISPVFPINDLPRHVCAPDAQMGYRPHGAIDAGRLSIVRYKDAVQQVGSRTNGTIVA